MTLRRTINYNWTVPQDDELVSHGADAIASLGDQVDASLRAEANARAAAVASTVKATLVHGGSLGDLKVYANRRAGDVLRPFVGAWVVDVPIPAFTDAFGALAVANASAGFTQITEVMVLAIRQGQMTIGWNVAGMSSPAPGAVAVDTSYIFWYRA